MQIKNDEEHFFCFYISLEDTSLSHFMVEKSSSSDLFFYFLFFLNISISNCYKAKYKIKSFWRDIAKHKTPPKQMEIQQ